MILLTIQRRIGNAPEGRWYWIWKEMWIPENSKAYEVLLQQGLLGIQGIVHALEEITVSKYQDDYEELGVHGHLVIKITI